MSATNAATKKQGLPTDVALLHEIVTGLEEQVSSLQRQLDWFKRHVFGKRSERVADDPNQLELLSAVPQTIAPAPVETQEIPAHTRSKHPGRREIPENIPRERTEYLPDETVCGGCGKELSRIGEEITKELDYQPASLILREHARIKLACSCCKSGVQIGELPAGVPVIEKGRVGPGLLAQVVTSKYCDHLPLHRLEGIFGRHGVEIPRSTQCDWVRQAADLLEPVYKELLQEVKSDGYVQVDETPVNYQDDRNELHRGYLWAMRSGIRPCVVFHFDQRRTKEVALSLLGDFSGYFQADDFASYDELAKDPRRQRLGCWAHVRRYFFDARGSASVKANEMLALIKQLYAIEREIKEQPPDEKRRRRAERATAVLEAIKTRCLHWKQTELPSSPLVKAANHALNQWSELCRYLEDGRLRIDNNAVEQQIRPVALGRKNYLFFGSVDGGRRAAILYTVINSCKLAGVEPFSYLKDVFRKVHTCTRRSELTPANWKKARTAKSD